MKQGGFSTDLFGCLVTQPNVAPPAVGRDSQWDELGHIISP